MERRLAAILAADVVGYSRLMGEDEVRTLNTLKRYRADLIDPQIAKHNGRIVKLMGDGALVEFASVVQAVACAASIQQEVATRNAACTGQKIQFRIGINVGDVIVEGDDIYGDGVNVATRLEGLAEPGGICISRAVRDQIRDKLDFILNDLGEVEVKNIVRPVRAFNVMVSEAGKRPTRHTTERVARNWKRSSVQAIVVLLIVVAGLAAWLQPWHAGIVRADQKGIAVLPFENMSGDSEQDYFSDGITEDLITDVSQISGLLVVARHTMLTYKGRTVSIRKVGEELDVRYVLGGSVRKAGNRVRINAQLIDTTSGQQLWAERFDREMAGVFALQDEVVRKIVSALAVTLTPNEQKRLSRAVQVNPEAYDMLLRGLERYRRFTHATNIEAREYFERAAAIDPKFARAYADIGLTHAEEIFHGWSASPAASSRAALEMAQHALKLDGNSSEARFTLAYTHLNMKRFELALVENQHILNLDPNHSDSHAQRGLILNYFGRSEEALQSIQTAIRLNPHAPFFYVWILGQSYFFLGRTEDAIEQFKKVINSNPNFVIGHLMLASAYAHAGRIDDAQWEADEVLVQRPNFTLAAERKVAAYKDPKYLKYYLEGLRKAGFPE